MKFENKKSELNTISYSGGGLSARWCRCIAVYSFILCSLITLGGCRTRQLVKTTPQMDADSRFWIRVLLLDDVNSCTIKSKSPLSIMGSADTTPFSSKKGSSLAIKVTNQQISIDGRLCGKEVVILPQQPHIFSLNDSEYRGKVRLSLNETGDSFDTVNLVPLEPYLAGVVGAEMPDYWEPQALQAQAIAARTYCLYIKKRFGGKRSWDLTKTTSHQVYRGLEAESRQVWDTIEATWGQVLVCKQNLTEAIFPTYYSSTCGGHTENSANVFGDSFVSLGGVPCDYCKNVAKPHFFFWPMAKFDKTEVITKLHARYPKLQQLGEIEKITAEKLSDYDRFSRITMVKVTGSGGKSDFLRAEDLRLTIDPTGRKIKSTICKIVSLGDEWAFVSGRGFGHGVGMCQCGAQGMARRKKTAYEILSYYYPGSRIVRVY